MRSLKLVLSIMIGIACLTILISIFAASHVSAGQSIQDELQFPSTSPQGYFPGSFHAIDIADGHAFLLDDALHVVDVSDPTTPFEVAVWNGFMDPPTALDVKDGYAFITVSRGMYILDVADPTRPSQAGFLPLPDAILRPARYVHVAGDHAYIARRSCPTPHHCLGDIQIASVALPETPTVVGVYTTSPGVVTVEGDRAYYSWSSLTYGGLAHSGFGILDVSDPTNPAKMSSLEVTTSPYGPYAWGIAARNGYVYLALTGSNTENPGLAVFDVSDPTNPARVGFFETIYPAQLVALQGDRAFVTEADPFGALDERLWAIDITDPGTPRLANFFAGVNAQDIAITPDTTSYLNKSRSLMFAAKLPPHSSAEPIFETSYIYYVNESQGMFILPNTGPQVSGRVLDLVGTPFSEVSIIVSDSLTATTDLSGEYILVDVPPGSHTLAPSASGYLFWPPSRVVTVPPDAHGQNFTILAAPASITLSPGEAGHLNITDTQGLPTRLDFPAGAVSVTTTVTLTPTVVRVGAGHIFAGHAFDLATVPVGSSPTGVAFNVPVSVTVYYSDLDVKTMSDEAGLALWWWEGSGWVDGTATCDPPVAYNRDPVANVLGSGICQAGRFALVGPTHAIYLPAISSMQ